MAGLAIGPIAQGVSSLIGGWLGSRAAKKAAAAQELEARIAAGKVGEAVGQGNEAVSQASIGGQQLALQKGQGVVDAAQTAAGGVNQAVTGANALLNPYAAAGTTAAGGLNAGIAEGGQFNRAPTMADIQIDPGYAFRERQAEISQANSAFAKGGGLGGGAAQDLMALSQGNASQEYQKAFDRYRQTTQDRFSNLFNVSRAGQEAAGTQGSNLVGGAKYVGDITTDASKSNLQAGEFAANLGMNAASDISGNLFRGAMGQGDFLTQAGNAKASGITGAAGAWTNALQGVANQVPYNLLRNPAVSISDQVRNLPMRKYNTAALTPGISFG